MSISRLFARVKNLEIISTRLVQELMAGGYRSVFKGPGLEFSEVREYVDGDDPRMIDWNVSARTDGVYTKTFREERELNLFLLVDVSSSMFSGRGENSIREVLDLLFSVFTFAAVNNNDKVGACFFTDRIEFWGPPAKGRAHSLRLIQDLLDFVPTGKGSDLGLALRTTGEALKRRGICVVISDFKTSAYQKDLGALARRHDVIAIRLISPEDLDFPSDATFQAMDPETGKSMTAFGISPKFRRDYREYWIGERKNWIHDCKRRGVSPMEVSSEDDPLAKLFHFFERRRHKRGQR